MHRPQHNINHAAAERHRDSALGLFRPGFSLIEILVTISIIVLLVGLGVVAMGKFYAQAEIEKTRVLLQQLAGVETEYRAQSNGEFPDDDASSSLNPSPSTIDTSIEWFIYQASQFPATDDMMTKTLNTKFYTAASGAVPGTVVDSWGNPVEYKTSTDGSTSSTVVEGTGTTTFTFPFNSTPFFASAGPDGLWGSYTAVSGDVDITQPDEEAADNLYSFEIQ